jgi:hypothetical protein
MAAYSILNALTVRQAGTMCKAPMAPLTYESRPCLPSSQSETPGHLLPLDVSAAAGIIRTALLNAIQLLQAETISVREGAHLCDGGATLMRLRQALMQLRPAVRKTLLVALLDSVDTFRAVTVTVLAGERRDLLPHNLFLVQLVDAAPALARTVLDNDVDENKESDACTLVQCGLFLHMAQDADKPFADAIPSSLVVALARLGAGDGSGAAEKLRASIDHPQTNWHAAAALVALLTLDSLHDVAQRQRALQELLAAVGPTHHALNSTLCYAAAASLVLSLAQDPTSASATQASWLALGQFWQHAPERMCKILDGFAVSTMLRGCLLC